MKRMVVETDLRAWQLCERQPGEPETGLGVELGLLVSGARDDEHEQPVGAERAERSLGERHVAEVRRVERAAEDRRPHRVDVSSPTSTSAPVLAPAARKRPPRAPRARAIAPTTR